VVIRGLNQPHGMAFHNGYFYVANTDGVVRMKLDASGRAIGNPEQLNHYGGSGGHWTRSIVFGADGAMYVSIGSSCNLCIDHPGRALVMRYDENGQHGQTFAKGLRNAVGLAVHPVTKKIWATVNERDNLQPNHEDLPPDALNILEVGGDYGWPYCYNGQHPNPEFHNAARCAAVIPDALPLQAHSAPLGMTFLQNATQLPQDARSDLLIAFHGSWNRAVPTGAKVVRVHIRNNVPIRYSDFIVGWQRPDGSRWGRPVDLAVASDGSLLITDDGSGEIVRISRQ
jgi:glucose/arabinose dehydrogenase